MKTRGRKSLSEKGKSKKIYFRGGKEIEEILSHYSNKSEMIREAIKLLHQEKHPKKAFNRPKMDLSTDVGKILDIILKIEEADIVDFKEARRIEKLRDEERMIPIRKTAIYEKAKIIGISRKKALDIIYHLIDTNILDKRFSDEGSKDVYLVDQPRKFKINKNERKKGDETVVINLRALESKILYKTVLINYENELKQLKKELVGTEDDFLKITEFLLMTFEFGCCDGRLVTYAIPNTMYCYSKGVELVKATIDYLEGSSIYSDRSNAMINYIIPLIIKIRDKGAKSVIPGIPND